MIGAPFGIYEGSPCAAIGSGGVAAQAAATALIRHTRMDARQVAEVAMQIASSLCVFTNQELTIEELATHAKS